MADQFEALQTAGALQVKGGRIRQAFQDGDRAVVEWRPRGQGDSERLRVGRVINCTGAGGDLTRTDDPLLRGLIVQGAIRADVMGLGLEVNDACQAIAANGGANPALYAAGPMTLGHSWEVIAVPDIRNQVARLAATLTESLCGRAGEDEDGGVDPPDFADS